ncbi:hypothetical protein [Niastella sp. OAS944]|uniref:hypothetical protein n=1 Tax=Niastella sp. OAS944 TaxID=2664089 RepID=UPI00346A808B|nr:small basic protein [Chitinophagaceae bacterium OAS944]
MPHNITALILKGEYGKDIAIKYDLVGKDLGFNLTLFHVSHNYASYWQFIFGLKGFLESAKPASWTIPTELALAELMKKISATPYIATPYIEFAIISTDYFGGIGSQFASVYKNDTWVSKKITTINEALAYLGVTSKAGLDEFDTVGLVNIRSQPDMLDKYSDLCEKHDL